MSVTSNLVPCPDLQGQLDENFNTCNSSEAREPMPFLEFVSGPENNFGLQQKVSPGDGKIRTIELLYRQRLLESEVNENVENPTCISSTQRGVEMEPYTMDVTENLEIDAYFTIKQWAAICERGDVFIAKEIQRMLNALMRRLATKTAAQMVPLVGGWNSTVDTAVPTLELAIRTKKVGSDDIFPEGMIDLEDAYMQSLYCASKGIFAGRDLYKYARLMAAGCCANQGIDLGTIFDRYGYGVMYDKWVAAALAGYGASGSGAAYALSSQLGSMTLLKFAQNDIYNSEQSHKLGMNYYADVIFDPLTQIPVDVNIKNDCGKIYITMFVTTKLVALPVTLFQTGDENDGVNYSAVIEVVNT